MSNELTYYNALKLIARDFQTTDQMRRNSERDYGLPYLEVLEMAYDNMQSRAAVAIKGKRKPKE